MGFVCLGSNYFRHFLHIYLSRIDKIIMKDKTPAGKLREEIKRIKYVISHSPMGKSMEAKMIGKLADLEKELRELRTGNKELNLGKE